MFSVNPIIPLFVLESNVYHLTFHHRSTYLTNRQSSHKSEDKTHSRLCKKGT